MIGIQAIDEKSFGQSFNHLVADPVELSVEWVGQVDCPINQGWRWWAVGDQGGERVEVTGSRCRWWA